MAPGVGSRIRPRVGVTCGLLLRDPEGRTTLASGPALVVGGVAALLGSRTTRREPGRVAPRCFDAADTDDNGVLELTDAVRIFSWLFSGGAPPLPPTPSSGAYAEGDCGEDPTADGLGCETLSPTCS